MTPGPGSVAAAIEEAERIEAETRYPPALAELETRRWGPGGRAHFGDPRPGDFLGRGSQAHTGTPETEPEREAQAG